MALLEVKNLSTYFYTKGGVRKAVDGVSFSISIGETFGLVGESGSGKTVTALSILRLIDEPGRIVSGDIFFDPFDKLRVNPEQAQYFKPGCVERVDGRSILLLSREEMRRVRGADIAIVFQEPLTALNPVMTVGEQITEQILAHKKIGKREANDRAVELMKSLAVEYLSRMEEKKP